MYPSQSMVAEGTSTVVVARKVGRPSGKGKEREYVLQTYTLHAPIKTLVSLPVDFRAFAIPS